MLKLHSLSCVVLVLLLSKTGLLCAAANTSEASPVSPIPAEATEQAPINISEDTTYAPSDEELKAMGYYQELIATLEREGGVYDSQLSEVMLGLGNLYQKFGRHGDAAALFDRAFHITRVNTGLYSLDQLAILEELIESNRSLKNWQALDQNYHNMLWISKRHHGDDSTELLPLLDRVGRWHLTAWDLDQGDNPFAHLVEAEQLYNWAVEIIEADNGKEDLRLINALYGIALTNYQIAATAANTDDFDELRTGFRNARQTRRALEIQRAREDIIIRSYVKGRDALRQVVEIQEKNPILPIETQAMAMTHLGDWYLLFDKKNSSAQTYQDAYQLMQNDGIEKEKIDQFFGKPRTLPAISLPIEKKEEILPENPPYVLASFDVSPSGKAHNIQIIESSEGDNVRYRRKAKRSIAATRFRPRYENGQPVLTTGLNLRYVFTDEAKN